MKILMIGPAVANESNYGFGVASEQIATYLTQNSELTIISPHQADEMMKPAMRETISIATKTDLSNQKKINAEAVHIKLRSNLPAYIYSNSNTKTETKIKEVSSLESIQKELSHFTSQVIEHLADFEYEVIYGHDWLSIEAGIQLSRKFNKPFVLHIHSLDYDRTGKNSHSWLYELEKKGMQLADRIIAVSEYHAGIMQKYYGISSEKIHVIPLALPPVKAKEYHSPFEEKIVLFSGRLSHQKGIFRFIDIAESLLKTESDLRFIVAGAGELSEELVSRVKEKGLLPYFNFAGRISQEELHGLMAKSEVFIMPSVSEPFGLVALEAASKALPIVMSKNTGALEILKSAFVPKEESTEAYVHQIKTVLNNKKKVAEAVKQNQKAAKENDWAKVGATILETLKN